MVARAIDGPSQDDKVASHHDCKHGRDKEYTLHNKSEAIHRDFSRTMCPWAGISSLTLPSVALNGLGAGAWLPLACSDNGPSAHGSAISSVMAASVGLWTSSSHCPSARTSRPRSPSDVAIRRTLSAGWPQSGSTSTVKNCRVPLA